MPPKRRNAGTVLPPQEEPPATPAVERQKMGGSSNGPILIALLAVVITILGFAGGYGQWWQSLSSPQTTTPHPSPATKPHDKAGDPTTTTTTATTTTTPTAIAIATPADSMIRRRVIVIGAGLAGQSAAIVAAQNGAEVFLLDKEGRLGGNSGKATSGINAWGTAAQAAQHVHDSPQLFERDTFLSGKGGDCRPGLVRMLSLKSADAVAWLASFGIPLDVLSQLGGHSRKRTHRAPDKPDGTPVPIGYTMVSTLEKFIRANLADSVHIEPNARLLRLLHRTVEMPNGEQVVRVTGVEYEKRHPVPKGSDGTTAPERPAETLAIEADAVILATGGYSSDHTADSLLAANAPQLAGFPTTNGPWATGDGVKAASLLGAQLVDMDKVQLHPTGLLNPKDPMAKTLFLGPESLRGSGGILLNAKGERFINELELRSVVSQAIMAQGDVFPGSNGRTFAHCVLNDAAADAFGRATLGFYWNKMGLFTEAVDVAALAKLIGCDEQTLQGTLAGYENITREEGGKCAKTGKSVFPCVLGPQGPYYVAYVTPSIHYTMGGCLISPAAEIQSTKPSLFGSRRRPILGLFGAGEVTGGVHGQNRLGGNSLLECVVFGRIAGARAAAAANEPPTALAAATAKATAVVEELVPESGDEANAATAGGQLFLALPSAFQTSGLHLGQTVGLRGVHAGQKRTAYLHPTTTPGHLGSIGVYLPPRTSTFATPATEWLYSLQLGDKVTLVPGPAAPTLGERLASADTDRLVIVANAPEGVGAVLQLMQAAAEEPLHSKLASVRLVYSAANATELSYRQVLDACRQAARKGTGEKRFDCHFVLDEPPGRWTEGVGVLEPAAVTDALPPRDSAELARTTVVLAGSPAATGAVHARLVADGLEDGKQIISI